MQGPLPRGGFFFFLGLHLIVALGKRSLSGSAGVIKIGWHTLIFLEYISYSGVHITGSITSARSEAGI